jgi:hypothetical protein
VSRVALTEKQIRELLPFYDRVQASAALGAPGMLLGQIRWNQDGRWWLEVGFLEHELAKLITERAQR